MDNQRVLSALCYFSVFFAPFLLPIIVYFITPDREVKYHAKRSIISHLIPVGLGMVGFFIFMFGFFTMLSGDPYVMDPVPGFDFIGVGVPTLFMLLYAVVYLVVLFWNIIQGIKVLR